MKKLLFLLLIGLFFGCGPSKAELEARAKAEKDNIYTNPPKPDPTDEKSSYDFSDNDIEVRVIDSCEYVVYRGYNIIHKNNCRNPIHKSKTQE